jgi:hypothetical protein
MSTYSFILSGGLIPRFGKGILVIGLLAMVLGLGCKPRRYSDLPAEEIGLNTPTIYRDSLASDKRKETVKKPKRRVYYGIKTKKAFTKSVKGRNVLKKPQPPQPFVKDIYWLDRKRKIVRLGPIPEKEAKYAAILHGPYKKVLNRRTIAEGVFYLGAKHARWEEYLQGEDAILLEKTKWYKGYPKESIITYYDIEQTKIKEAKPIINGEFHGDYARFAASGALLEAGRFEHGVKIGQWREYFEERRRTKRVIQYAQNAFEKKFVPYVISEFDVTGALTYDKDQEDKLKAAKKPFKEAPIAPIARPSDTVKTSFKTFRLAKTDSSGRANPQGK